MFGRPSRMSGSGPEALWDVGIGREALLDVQEWSAGPPRSPRVVRRLFRMSESGREDFPNVRK